MELIGKATVPGAYLCDLIPISKLIYMATHSCLNISWTVKYLPACVPFRREAEKGKVMIEEFVSKPFHQIQVDIVGDFWGCNILQFSVFVIVAWPRVTVSR